MASGINTAGELTSEQVLALLVQPLLKASVLLAAGPRIFDSHGDPLRIPKLVGFNVDPAWHGENEQITEADPDFDELVLLPSTLKSVKVLHRFSNELARHSVVDIANALRDALVRRVAAKLDDAFFTGAGAANTVVGLLQQPGTQPYAAGAAFDVDDLHNAIGLLLGAEVDLASARWFVRSDDFVALRKLKDSTGRYIVEPDVTQAATYRLLGLPVTITNRLPATKLLLVDMSQVAIGRDLSPSVKLLDQTFADFDQLALRVVARYDLGLLWPKGVVVATTA